MGTTLTNFTSLVWMFEWACFPTFVISWYAQWSFDHCLHHHLSKITSFFKQWPTWRWLDFVTTFQNNLAVTKQQIVKKYFHQSWNINCPILFNTISFYTEMISISLFLGFHIELNILGTRDISCVLHEIQIWNTIIGLMFFFKLQIHVNRSFNQSDEFFYQVLLKESSLGAKSWVSSFSLQ